MSCDHNNDTQGQYHVAQMFGTGNISELGKSLVIFFQINDMYYKKCK